MIKFAAVHGAPVIINNTIISEEVAEQPCAPEEPKPDPKVIIDISQKKAEQIIAKAEKQAEECIAAANEQIKELRKNAFDEGHERGYQDGFSQGKMKAEEESKQAKSEAVQKAQTVVKTAQQTAQEMILNAERQIIEIALSISRKVLAREMEENPMAILPIVNEALEKVKNQDKVTIRVNAEDYPIVLQAQKEFQMLLGREGIVNITVDQTLEAGSCMIDTPYGNVDATLDSKIEMIEKALREIMP